MLGNRRVVLAAALLALTVGVGGVITSAGATTSRRADPTPLLVSPDPDDPPAVTNDPVVSFFATGTPGDTMSIVRKADAKLLCRAQVVDGAGDFSCTVRVADGTTPVVARERSQDGTVTVDSRSVTLRIDTHAPRKPRFTSPFNGSVTRGRHVTLAGTAEPRSHLEVSRAGHVTDCELTVASSGRWSCVITVFHSAEEVAFALATDAAGNTSEAGTVDWFVDTVAPNRPHISHPVTKQTVKTRRPTFSGTAARFTTVRVEEGRSTLCTARPHAASADRVATWSCRPRKPLGVRRHVVVAVEIDRAGHRIRSLAVSFTVR